jgi:hypothetical protein
MMSKQIQTARQKKIDQLLSLMSGNIKPSDIGPKMVINFNTPEGDIYLINGKPVDKVTFDSLLETLPTPFYPRFECHGRPGDDGQLPEPYYYGEVSFSIYKDGRPLLT